MPLRKQGAQGTFSAEVRRMSSRRIVVICGLALLAFAAVCLLESAQPYAYMRLRLLYRDGISRAGRTTPANPNLVFLAIDSSSVSLDETDIDEFFGLTGDDPDGERALRLMSRRFPWPREVYALILKRLVEAGAKSVAFDLTFPGSTDDDPILRAALDKYRDHVVVGSNFVDGSLTRPTETLIPQTKPMDSRIGFTNYWADDDDVVRRAQYRVTFEQVRGMLPGEQSEKFSSLAAVALRKAGFAGEVPPDLKDRALRFTAPPRTGFPPRSLFEIFVPEFWKRNYQGGEFFRDKIVIVGADGNWQHDEHPTPFGNMPGAELHLNAMNAAIHGEFVRELPPSACVLFTALAGAIGIIASLFLRSPWTRLVACLLLVLGVVGLSLLCFNHASFFLPTVPPLLVFTATMLFALVYDFAAERVERKRVRRVLERYVSRDVVRELVNRPYLYAQSLGGVTRPVAILFSDIRSYSAVAARSSPEALVAQLNEYFTAMVDCVFQSGGTLDKFIGDALMAVWGGLRSNGAEADATAAVTAALAMQEKLVELNKDWRARRWPELRIGIAVHYGPVIVGNIGSPQRMEFTVIGDPVNMTWKLQELTKKRGTSLIVSETVATLVREHFELQSLEAATIDESHQLWEIYTPLGAPASTKKAPAGAGA